MGSSCHFLCAADDGGLESVVIFVEDAWWPPPISPGGCPLLFFQFQMLISGPGVCSGSIGPQVGSHRAGSLHLRGVDRKEKGNWGHPARWP